MLHNSIILQTIVINLKAGVAEFYLTAIAFIYSSSRSQRIANFPLPRVWQTKIVFSKLYVITKKRTILNSQTRNIYQFCCEDFSLFLIFPLTRQLLFGEIYVYRKCESFIFSTDYHKAFLAQFEQAVSQEERLQLLQVTGYEFTVEEWKAATDEIQATTASNDGLSDTDLQAISGGINSLLPVTCYQ